MSDINNTYISYSELLAMLHPYFLTRGGEDFLRPSELAHTIALAIQDIYNNSNLSFAAEFDICEKQEEKYKDMFFIYKTSEPINVIHEILLNGEGEDLSSQITNHMPHSNMSEFHFKKGTNIIYSSVDTEYITVNYQRNFTRNMLLTDSDLQKEVPLPFAYIPALQKWIFDYSAPLTFFRGEGDEFDFYSHGQARLNKLEQTDILTSNERVILN